MRHHRKVAAGVSAASVLAPGTALLQAWSAHERADAAGVSQASFQCEVAVCEASGGRWWRGECERIAPEDVREPK